MSRAVHAVIPIVVISAVTALVAMGKLSADTGLATILSAGSVGALTVAGGRTIPPK